MCSFAVQLQAGGKLISALTGIPFSTLTADLAFTFLSSGKETDDIAVFVSR